MGDAHRGVSNLNCPVCTFSVAADVGTGIDCVGGSAVEGESRVYLPAVGEARWSTEGGNGVIEVSGEGIANIEVGVSVLCLLVPRILLNIRKKPGLIVECM